MGEVAFYRYDVGKLDPVEIGNAERKYEEVVLPKGMTNYMVKQWGEIPFDVDYVYIREEHIIETIPPASRSMSQYLKDGVYVEGKKCSIESVLPALENGKGSLRDRIDKYIEEDQRGMTIVTDIRTGEEKIYLQYNYIPKYTSPYRYSFETKDIPDNGNIEGIVEYNVENVQLENINRYKFLILLKVLLYKKSTLRTDTEWGMASLKRTIVVLNVLLNSENFSISDNGEICWSIDLLGCFQYDLPDDWEASNQKSYKKYFDEVCTSVAALNAVYTKEEYSGSDCYTHLCNYLSDDERKETKKKVAENAVLAEHYNLEELKRKKHILKWRITRLDLFYCYMLQKLVEDYLWFKKGYQYNYKMFDEDRRTGYYEEHYGTEPDIYNNKNFSCDDYKVGYISYVLGYQKAFINDNKVFLGEYINERKETFGIEIEIRKLTCILTLRFVPKSSKIDKFVSEKERKWELKQRVEKQRYGDEYDYSYYDERDEESRREMEQTIISWITNVQPQIHATMELEEKTIILEETLKCNVITIGELLKGIKKIYKEYKKLIKGSLGIYDYIEEKLKLLEEEYDWREDYIDPRDYWDSWEE